MKSSLIFLLWCGYLFSVCLSQSVSVQVLNYVGTSDVNVLVQPQQISVQVVMQNQLNVSTNENSCLTNLNQASVPSSSSSSSGAVSSSLSSSPTVTSSSPSVTSSSSPSITSSSPSVTSSSSPSVTSSSSPSVTSSSPSVTSSSSPSVTSSSLLSSSSAATSYSSTGIYIPFNWNQRFVAQLNLTSTQLIKIGVLGDSISAGSYASNQLPSPQGTGWINLLQTQLQAIYGDGGSGFVELSQTPQFSGNQYYSYPSTIPCTTAGSWMTNTGSSGSAATFYLNTFGTGDTASCYTRGTSVHIYYFPSANPFTISIDSGPATQFPATNPLGNFMTETIINGLSNTAHSVVLTTTGSFTLCGMAGFNSVGVVVNGFVIPGLQSAIMQVNSNGAVWNYTGGTAIPSLESDLLIISLGANDGSTPPTNINTDYQTFLTGARTSWFTQIAASQQSIMILEQNYGNYITADITASIPIRLAAAQQYNCAYLDLYYLLGNNSWTYSISQGFWSLQGASGFGPAQPLGASGTNTGNSNYIHPSDSGHRNITNFVLPYLLQNAFSPPAKSSSSASISSSTFSSSVLSSSVLSSSVPISSSSSPSITSSSPLSSSSSVPPPPSLPSPSVWLIADSLSGSLSNGSAVTSWVESVYGHAFTPVTSAPIYVTHPSTLNTHSAVYFNGVAGLGSTVAYPNNIPTVTICMVFAPGPTTGTYMNFISNTAGWRMYTLLTAIGFLSDAGGGFQNTFYQQIAGTYQTIALLVESQNNILSFYVNGAYYGVLPSATIQGSSASMNLGTDEGQSTNVRFIGYMYEVEIFNQTLNNTNINLWFSYVGQKYNLSIAQPGPSTANTVLYPSATLPTPNIWMIADSLATNYSYGAYIAEWIDITTNQYPFLAAGTGYPVYHAGTNTNGHSCIRLDGGTGFINNNVWQPASLPATVFYVMGPGPSGGVFYSTTSQYNIQVSTQNSGTIEISTAATLTNYSGIPLDYTPITVLMELQAANTIGIWVNGIYSGVYTTAITSATPFLGLGIDFYHVGGTGDLLGDLYEVIVIYQQLSFAQKSALFNYSYFKYNVQ